eukprot:2204057-Prymnesium_polylepis.1
MASLAWWALKPRPLAVASIKFVAGAYTNAPPTPIVSSPAAASPTARAWVVAARSKKGNGDRGNEKSCEDPSTKRPTPR